MKTEKYWKNKLSSQQYHILREKGTEAAFSGRYWNNKSKGNYLCAACGIRLLSSETKIDSGTGWPSFTDPINKKNIGLKEDLSHGMRRTEVTCKKCGSHLGHVFKDGSVGKGGKRFCINSCSLDFKKQQGLNKGSG